MRSPAGTSRLALVVSVCIAAGAAAAAGYAVTAPKRYRATAQILVAPVSPGDPIFAGLGVLRDTGGRRTAAADVAALLRGPQIADAVAASLALRRSRSSVEHALRVQVVEGSDVVDVEAEDTSGTGAAELANAFAGTLIAQRSAAFQSDLSAAIHRDERLLAATPAARLIAQRLTTLKGFVGRPDPTLRVASEAAAPTDPSWPRVGTLVGVGAAIGAAAGLLAALLLLAVRAGRPRARQYDRPVSDRAAEELADRLEARLVAREAALAARERDLQAKLDELRSLRKPEADDSDLRRREEELAERVAAVTKREVELAKRAAELALRERERPARVAQAPAPAPAARDGHGQYSLPDLERLVGAHRAEHPDRVEEWESYLFFLRDYASPDGRIPASFDWLIADTFADIL